MAKEKRQIDYKDKADDISKIIADKLNDLKAQLQLLSYSLILKQNKKNISKWYTYQTSNLNAFKREIRTLINEQKKQIRWAIKAGCKELDLISNQFKKIEQEVERGLKQLENNVIERHLVNVNTVYNSFQTKKVSNVSKRLFETIYAKMMSNKDYGTVEYKGGRNIRWENYMEMLLRTEFNKDITEQTIQTAQNVGLIFYTTSFYGDCAPDHADFQGKIYVDENWRNIADSRQNEIETYIENNRIMTIQEVVGEQGNFFTTRPNCRHYFLSLSTDEVLGISSEKQLVELREKHQLNFNGRYMPEKYEALKKQRYNERKIRSAKQEVSTIQTFLKNVPKDLSEEKKAKLLSNLSKNKRKVAKYQKDQRELIKANKGVLERNYDREVYGKMISDFRISQLNKKKK